VHGVLASAERATRVASSRSSFPCSRRSLRAVVLTSCRLATAAQVASEAGAVLAGSLDRPDPASPRTPGRFIFARHGLAPAVGLIGRLSAVPA
jgi:hypothetical protein